MRQVTALERRMSINAHRTRPTATARRGFQTGCSGVASSSLQPLYGGRVKLRTRQTVPSQDSLDDDTRLETQASALTQPGPTSTVPQQHHVSRSRPCVLGSPPSLLAGSHTQPANTGIAAHGCYRVVGPARITKRGDCLLARLLPGARLELLSAGGQCASAVEALEYRYPPAAPSALPHSPASAGGGGGTSAPVHRTVLEAAEAAARSWDEGDDVQCTVAGDGYGDWDGYDMRFGEGQAWGVGVGSEGDGEEDDGAVAECVLVASYVELGGSACSVDLADSALQPAVHHHHGHTYLSVRNLPPSAVITLHADGDLSHPVNVTPEPPQ